MSNRKSERIRATPHSRRRPTQGRRVWWIVGALFATVALLSVVVIVKKNIGRDVAADSIAATTLDVTPVSSVATPVIDPPALPPSADLLAAEFTQFESTLDAVAGIAIGAVGSTNPPILIGDLPSGLAWSTIKVPLAIAALRNSDPPTVTDTMNLAITESDNAASESIWTALGDPVDAAHRVEEVLRSTGDPTPVQSQRVRPPYTPFGQTEWSLIHQVQFISSAACDGASAPILHLMGQIEPSQSWGIGTIGGSQFKGGWGPSEAGAYLVRQFGVLNTQKGKIAIAMAVKPTSGQFDDGTADLTKMAQWLADHLEALPAGQCGP